MGVNLVNRHARRTEYVTVPNPLNPDPKKFHILDVEFVNGYTIVEVEYPNCNNYEGKKIVVFKGDKRKMLYSIRELDPHFEKDNDIVARFVPTKDGMEMALHFCQTLGF